MFGSDLSAVVTEARRQAPGRISGDRAMAMGCIDIAAEFYDLRRSDILGSAKEQPAALARHIAVWLLRRADGRSMPKIARIIGYRDHTVVLYAIRKIDRMRGDDRLFKTVTDQMLKRCISGGIHAAAQPKEIGP